MVYTNKNGKNIGMVDPIALRLICFDHDTTRSHGGPVIVASRL